MSRASFHDIIWTTETPVAFSNADSKQKILPRPTASSPDLSFSFAATAQPFPNLGLSNASTPLLGFRTVQPSSLRLRRYFSDLAWPKKDSVPISAEFHDGIMRDLRDRSRTDVLSPQSLSWVQRTIRHQRCRSQGSLLIEESQDSWIARRKEVSPILCDAHQKRKHDGRDVTTTEIRRDLSYVPTALNSRSVGAFPVCIGRTRRAFDPIYSRLEVGVYKRDKCYETDYLESRDEAAHEQYGPDMPCVEARFQEDNSRSRIIEGLPFGTDRVYLLFRPTPRLCASEVPWGPFICGERTSALKDDHCNPLPSLRPVSIVVSHIPVYSGKTTSWDTDIDATVSQSLTASKSTSGIPFRKSLIGRASSSFVAKHCDPSYIANGWGNQRPHRPVIHARSMGCLRSTERDEIMLGPASMLRVVFPLPEHPVSDVQTSDQSRSEVLLPTSKRPEPINVQKANAPFPFYSKEIPERQVSLALSPWRCSYSKVAKTTQGRPASPTVTDAKTAASLLSRTCTDTFNREVDLLPPTPSSAASMWSQDSAPNSAIFWNANAREYSSNEEDCDNEDALELEIAQMLKDPATFGLLTTRDHSSQDGGDDELPGGSMSGTLCGGGHLGEGEACEGVLTP